jgi:hypothetical protein
LPIFNRKNVTTFYQSLNLQFFSVRLFSVPQVKGLHFADVAKIKDAVNDELNKVQEEEFRQVVRKCTTAQKPVYMPMELILSKKFVFNF